jgi:hypothetical protein
VAISYRRGAHKESDSSSTTIAVAYSSNDLGDLGWLGVGWLDPAGTIDVSTVADGAGNTWATAGGKVRNATQQYAGRIYYVPTGMKLSASNTVTVTFSASAQFRRLDLLEYKSSNGAWGFDALDATNGATGNSTSLSSGNMTPALGGELVAGFGASEAGNIYASSPYTLRQPSGGGQSAGATERVLSGNAGIAVAAQARSTGSGNWIMLGALFKDVPAQGESTLTAPVVVSVTSARARGPALMSGG